mmetsp:Transcript_11765/g.37324  ORF Transcript_11765/g.37324 Transcript_11765/m.37324 type:complete len:219 (+) Transcript_11765:669-1325(+)
MRALLVPAPTRPSASAAPCATAAFESCDSLPSTSTTLGSGFDRCVSAMASGTARRVSTSPYANRCSNMRLDMSRDRSSPIDTMARPSVASAAGECGDASAACFLPPLLPLLLLLLLLLLLPAAAPADAPSAFFLSLSLDSSSASFAANSRSAAAAFASAIMPSSDCTLSTFPVPQKAHVSNVSRAYSPASPGRADSVASAMSASSPRRRKSNPRPREK